MIKKYLSVIIAATLVGCATDPDKMATAYISPIQYKQYDCDQIAEEMARVSSRTQELHGILKKGG